VFPGMAGIDVQRTGGVESGTVEMSEVRSARRTPLHRRADPFEAERHLESGTGAYSGRNLVIVTGA
jgi:hypothetical protein